MMRFHFGGGPRVGELELVVVVVVTVGCPDFDWVGDVGFIVVVVVVVAVEGVLGAFALVEAALVKEATALAAARVAVVDGGAMVRDVVRI